MECLPEDRADAGREDGPGAKTQKEKAAGRQSRGFWVSLFFVLGISLICMLYTATLVIRSQPLPQVAVLPTLAHNQPRPEDPLAASEVLAMAGPSVVSINIYDAGGVTPVSTGSGIILSENGYIVTNAHVVSEGGAAHVRLYDGTGYTGRIVGTDLRNDLALVKIDAAGLAVAELGDSSQLQAGERVYAIGNATGSLPGSITQGLVSGVNRQVPISTGEGVVYMNLIQTDAAINPGNSGGALVNANGQVVGITLGKVQSENVENVGFAIPINHAAAILQGLIDSQPTGAPPKLGVVCEALNETTGPPNGLPAQGLYIVEITPESNLNSHGVLPGDVLLSADGQTLAEVSDLTRAVSAHQAGELITLEVYRYATQEVETIEVALYVE